METERWKFRERNAGGGRGDNWSRLYHRRGEGVSFRLRGRSHEQILICTYTYWQDYRRNKAGAVFEVDVVVAVEITPVTVEVERGEIFAFSRREGNRTTVRPFPDLNSCFAYRFQWMLSL